MLKNVEIITARLGQDFSQWLFNIGWQAGIANGHGSRPKGMHQTTYNRLVKEHDELAAMIYASYGKWLAQRTKQLQKSL